MTKNCVVEPTAYYQMKEYWYAKQLMQAKRHLQKKTLARYPFTGADLIFSLRKKKPFFILPDGLSFSLKSSITAYQAINKSVSSNLVFTRAFKNQEHANLYKHRIDPFKNALKLRFSLLNAGDRQFTFTSLINSYDYIKRFFRRRCICWPLSWQKKLTRILIIPGQAVLRHQKARCWLPN